VNLNSNSSNNVNNNSNYNTVSGAGNQLSSNNYFYKTPNESLQTQESIPPARKTVPHGHSNSINSLFLYIPCINCNNLIQVDDIGKTKNKFYFNFIH